MTFGSPANIWFGNAFHADGSHQASVGSKRFEGILQSQTIHDRCEHSHIVSRCFSNARISSCELGTAENIATANDDGNFDSVFCRLNRLF